MAHGQQDYYQRILVLRTEQGGVPEFAQYAFASIINAEVQKSMVNSTVPGGYQLSIKGVNVTGQAATTCYWDFEVNGDLYYRVHFDGGYFLGSSFAIYPVLDPGDEWTINVYNSDNLNRRFSVQVFASLESITS